MGRPPKDIDAELVRKLAKIGSTQKDIAEFFDCSQSVISERFRSDSQLGSAESKISLRRMQWKAARAGSVPMLIHLGKVYLGQSDKLQVTTEEPPAHSDKNFEKMLEAYAYQPIPGGPRDTNYMCLNPPASWNDIDDGHCNGDH
jgi:hypothetical protein